MKETKELLALRSAAEKISDIAKKMGLEFGEVCFEVCPADVIYSVGAYGMPSRFAHWSFGKAFHKMKIMYDLNISRIYELVINTSPAYAFLLEGNSLIQNKLVIAHVFAHCDFFTNNTRFKDSGKYMMNLMSVHADRIREYEYKYGTQKVEDFLDAVVAIQEHIDPYPVIYNNKKEKIQKSDTIYDDIWSIGEVQLPEEPEIKEKNPPEPQKDIVKFIMENSRCLEEWQRDIMAMLRGDDLLLASD